MPDLWRSDGYRKSPRAASRSDPTPVSFVPVKLTQAFIHQGFAAQISRADSNLAGSGRRSILPKPATFRPAERECREINGQKIGRDQACAKAGSGEKEPQPPRFTIGKTAPDKDFGEKTVSPTERSIASSPETGRRIAEIIQWTRGILTKP